MVNPMIGVVVLLLEVFAALLYKTPDFIVQFSRARVEAHIGSKYEKPIEIWVQTTLLSCTGVFRVLNHQAVLGPTLTRSVWRRMNSDIP